MIIHCNFENLNFIKLFYKRFNCRFRMKKIENIMLYTDDCTMLLVM